MEKEVQCCECGKKFKVIETEFVFIPQMRCDSCLEKNKTR